MMHSKPESAVLGNRDRSFYRFKGAMDASSIPETLNLSLYKTKTSWINETTGEPVTVVGSQCPEGCREPTREEADRLFLDATEYSKLIKNAKPL
jgi:hypothetical protein